jgi:ABC-type antimicrobial peptide transport system permease subunit
MNKKGLFAIIGAVLGIPLSYYFQSEMVKAKVGGIGGYLKHFGDIVNNANLLGNVVLSVLIFTIVGGLIGYFVDKNEVEKNN